MIRPLVGISMGDPAGIGPEVIIKALKSTKGLPIIIIGSKKVFIRTCQKLNLPFPLRTISSLDDYQGDSALLDTVKLSDFSFGKPTKKSAAMALQAIDQAIGLLKRNKIKGLVTAPIWKTGIRFYCKNFIGHTEYLAEKFFAKDFAMMGISRTKRILFLTTHIPLRSVFKYITKSNIIHALKLLHRGLKETFKIKKPKIGVANLNPHGLEFSAGEDEVLIDAIRTAHLKGINAFGPFPADTLFNQTYDGFLALYHDQGMIFLKSRPDGVNFTFGLPIIRTSPLHGTAFDIAGHNRADANSMIAAIKLAVELTRKA